MPRVNCSPHCGWRVPSLLAPSFFLLLLACRFVAAQPSSGLASKALEGSTRLRNAFRDSSRIEELAKAYETAIDARLFTVEQADQGTEVAHLAEKISQMVARKLQALKESVTAVEEVAASYRFNPNIGTDDVNYLYCNELSDDNSQLEYDRRYLQKVAWNHSAVHIPTNIYRGRTDVLNQLTWTHHVEHKMLELASNEEYFQDTARYIYMSTDMGMLRLFPGMKWRTLEGVTSMYDARRTSWFIEGSTCSKDVLILIDTSGSMHGQNLLLTKQAARSVINTLGENDYVAVGQYPGKPLSAERTDSPHLLHDKESDSSEGNTTCFHTFVQATGRYKKRLFSQIDGLSAKGIVELTEAIDFAFRTFESYENGSTNNHGASCSSVVMLFTDGDISSDMDRTTQLIRSYKKKSDYMSKVRIFIYSVGQHRNPDQPLIELACRNRGSFTDVPQMGAVTSDVQEGYLATLRNVGALYEANQPVEERSGPTMVLHSHFDPSRHGTFLFFSEMQIRDLGLGILTSLTLPIYNTSGNNTFLGIIGTDIAIKDWEALVPKHKLGPIGYAFSLNSNGKIVFHPDVKKTDGWHREPSNLDLVEVELDSEEKQQIRDSIVNSISASSSGDNATVPLVTKETLRKISDGAHVYKATLGYAYKHIDGSPYAVSIAMPPGGNRYAAFGPSTRAAFEQEESGAGQWTVTLLSDSEEAAAPAQSVTYPSPWTGFLVPNATPYCSEYYMPPPPAKATQRLGVNGTSGNDSSAAVNATTASSRPSPTRLPPAAPVDEHAVVEQTERLRLEPKTMENLLQTLALNSSSCSRHWASALALDAALMDRFFAGFSERPLGQEARSAAATGLSGVTGVFPPGEAARYGGWSEGWSAGHCQRAFLMPDMLFASVPLLQALDYNQSVIEPTTSVTTIAAAPSTSPAIGKSTWMVGTTASPEPVDVTLFKAVTLKDGFSAAVSGVTVSGRWLADTIFMNTFASLCHPGQSNNTCYLVEDGGYIVSANGELDTIGHFLGTIDKPLMRHLVFNLSVFASVQEYDFQGICRKKQETMPGKYAQALQPYSLSLLMLPAAASMLLHQSGLSHQLMLLPLLELPLALANKNKEETTKDCIKMGYRYYRTTLRDSRASDSQQTSPDELGRPVTLAYLEGTNLLLVAVGPLPPQLSQSDLGQSYSTGDADYDELRRDPAEDKGPDVCAMDARYRVRSGTCYRSHPKEEKVCSAASFVSSSSFAIASVSAAVSAIRLALVV